MCPQCKNNHVTHLRTIDHDVVTFSEKLKKNIPKQGLCVRLSNMVYRKYCETCELFLCYHSRKLRNHIKLDARAAFERKRQHHREVIDIIRSDALFYRPVLLKGIKANIKICHTKFSYFHSDMLTKAQRLKDQLDIALWDIDVKHVYLKEKINVNLQITRLQKYENIYERSAIKPLQFLKTNFMLPTCQVVDSLSTVQIADRGKLLVKKKCQLKLMSSPEFLQCFTVTDIDCCHHISCAGSNHAWISGVRSDLRFTNTTGCNLENWKNLLSDFYRNGLHTVNSEGELIYIAWDHNINKISKDMQEITTFIQNTHSPWEPRCVHCSLITGDLLVGMVTGEQLDAQNASLENAGKVLRYNRIGELLQTIQYTYLESIHVYSGRYDQSELYSEPKWIAENNNGDIVVSDDDSTVVVTEMGGIHRFSYTGHPSDFGLVPQGICTDTFSNILVCDLKTNTVQIIDKDGQFLSHLLINLLGNFSPHSLSYDINLHRLWVGSGLDSTVCIYRYIDRHDSLTGKSHFKKKINLLNSALQLCVIQSYQKLQQI